MCMGLNVPANEQNFQRRMPWSPFENRFSRRAFGLRPDAGHRGDARSQSQAQALAEMKHKKGSKFLGTHMIPVILGRQEAPLCHRSSSPRARASRRRGEERDGDGDREPQQLETIILFVLDNETDASFRRRGRGRDHKDIPKFVSIWLMIHSRVRLAGAPTGGRIAKDTSCSAVL